jgi:hypothetical protein
MEPRNVIEFSFGLGQAVQIIASEKVGTVRGLAQHLGCPKQAYVRYIDGKGDVADKWFNESDLCAELPTIE